MATTLTELKKMQKEIERLKKQVDLLVKLESATQSHRPRKAIAANGKKKRAGNGNGHSVPARRRTKQAAPDMNLRRHFGSIRLGYATGLDNESIDRDLEREYLDDHKES